MNGLLGSLFSKLPDSARIDDLSTFHTYERLVEANALTPAFSRFEVIKTEVKQSIYEVHIGQKTVNSIMQILEEVVPNPPPTFPLLIHLRLCKPKLTFDEFISIFELKNFSDRSHFPFTCYLISNRKELIKLKVVLAFKEFYSVICKSGNGLSGNLSRAKAEKLTIEQLFLAENRSNELEKSLKKFMKLWNFAIGQDNDSPKVEVNRQLGQRLSVQLECETVNLTPISFKSKLNELLPTRFLDNKGVNVMVGIRSLMTIHNRLVANLQGNIGQLDQQLLWENVCESTLFDFNLDQFERIINSECVATHVDWGRFRGWFGRVRSV